MRSLTLCLRALQREVHLLASLFESQAGFGVTSFWINSPPCAAQSYAIVRLHDSWARFCRRLILSSADGNTLTSTGFYVPKSPIILPGQSSLDALKMTYKTNRQSRVLWEPRWHDAGDAVDAATRLQVGNLSTISAALGAAGNGVRDLTGCRNFLAHRSKLSNVPLALIRTSLSLPSSASVRQIANYPAADGTRLYRSWCRELLLRANVAVT